MKYCQTYFEGIERVIKENPHLEELNRSSILITGAGGLLCSSICDLLLYLNQKYKANNTLYFGARNKDKIVNRFNIYDEGKEYFYIQYDASKSFASDYHFDYIIHGASNAVPALFDKEPVETIVSAINGMNQLLQFAKKSKVKRVLYISSGEIYGKKNNSDPYKEEECGYMDILNPRACYPSSKRTCETLCASYTKEYNVDSVIVRPCHVYGPQFNIHDNRASSAFLRDVLTGDIIMKSAGTQFRSYCYSLDATSAILTVLLKGKSDNAYNIANINSNVTIRNYAECLAKISKRKIIFENPSDTEIKSYNLMDNSCLDCTKIQALGWKPCFNLDEGLRHTLRII